VPETVDIAEEFRPLVVLDVEASGLPPGTFPIEVGITYVETGETRTWLIRPTAEWRSWRWDPEAEKIHGISREYLEQNGTDTSQVYSGLLAAIASHEVLTDSRTDDTWLLALARSCGEQDVGFRTWSVWNIVELLAECDEETIVSTMDAAEKAFPVRNRAGPDSAHWAHVIRSLAGLEPASDVSCFVQAEP
jgi:hypothetical protein